MNNYRITKLMKALLFFSVYILFIGNAYANSYFSIKNIEIELEFDNDKDIRNLAIEKAQVQALEDLSEKLLSPNDYEIFLADKEEEKYSYLVESIEFVDETITEEYYKGIFNINFNPYKIREYYTSRSLMFSEVKSKEIKVFTILDKQNSFFILNNIWNTEWIESVNKDVNLELNIQTFDHDQYKNISLNSFLSGDFDHPNLLGDSSNVVFIWCEPKLISNGMIEFNIISKIIVNNKNTIFRSTYTDEYNLYKDDLIDSIISDLKEQILVNWVRLTSQADEKFKYTFNFNFESINEWVSLKAILETIELISNYHILSFDLHSVEGIIEFHGDNNKFELVLSQNNILPVNLGKIYKIQVLR